MALSRVSVQVCCSITITALADSVSGAFSGIEKFVTSRISLEDVVENGLKELIDNKDDHVKILVTPKKNVT